MALNIEYDPLIMNQERFIAAAQKKYETQWKKTIQFGEAKESSHLSMTRDDHPCPSWTDNKQHGSRRMLPRRIFSEVYVWKRILNVAYSVREHT